MLARVWAFVRTLVFLVFVVGTIAVIVPLAILQRAAPAPPLVPGLGPLLLALAAILWFWSGFGFSFVGRGTPSPIDAPRALVVWGPYRYVRNPMYVAVLLAIFGFAIENSSIAVALYGLVVLVAFHMFVLWYEEPTLERRFGDDYVRYKRTVGRWIPRPR